MTLLSMRLQKKVNTYFVFLMTVLWAAAGCRTEPPPTPERPQAVRVIAPERRDLVHEVSYVGTVRSAREVKVLARVAGTLEALPVAEGERVAQGAVLARISAPELGARLDQAQAELERTTTERDYACETFATDQRLYDQDAISRAQLDRSRRQCRSSEGYTCTTNNACFPQ